MLSCERWRTRKNSPKQNLFQDKMRKAKPKKRLVLPDPVFNDQKVSKFVNHLMYDGKKTISYEIFYNALDIVKGKMAKGYVYGVKTNLQLTTSPDTAYVINGCGLQIQSSTADGSLRRAIVGNDIAVGTDGYIYINVTTSSSTLTISLISHVIYFVDFHFLFSL